MRGWPPIGRRLEWRAEGGSWGGMVARGLTEVAWREEAGVDPVSNVE